MLGDIGRALGLERPYEPDANTRVHDAAVRADGRVAWVEERRVGEDDGGFVDCDLWLKVAWGGALQLTADLPTYNPYFGCTVYGMAWTRGDRVVLAYHEKHASLVSTWTMGGEVTLTRVELFDAVSVDGDFVVYRDDEPGLVQVIATPSLEACVPIPVPSPELALEAPGVLAAGPQRVRLPSSAQQGVVRDRPAFVEEVLARLEHEAPGAPRATLELIAGACLPPFLAQPDPPGSSYSTISSRRWGTPVRWFPAYWFEWLRDNGRRDEAERVAVTLDALEPRSVPAGWEPTWSLETGAVELALEHVAQRAAALREVCASGRLPGDAYDGLWSYTPRVELSQFPPGFQDAFAQVAASPPRSFSERKQR